MSKVRAEWIEGEVGGSGTLQQAYDKSPDGSILTDAVRGSVDLRGGETGADQAVLTVGYTGKAPSTRISGRNAVLAAEQALVEDIQAAALIGGYCGVMHGFSHGSVTLGGSFTEITDSSENSTVQSSSYVKLKRAFHSSIIASSALPFGEPTDPASEITGSLEFYSDPISLPSSYQGTYPTGSALFFGNRYLADLTAAGSTLNPELEPYFKTLPGVVSIINRSGDEFYVQTSTSLLLSNRVLGTSQVVLGGVGVTNTVFTEGMPATSLSVSTLEYSNAGKAVLPSGDLLFVYSGYRVVRLSSTDGNLYTFAGNGVSADTGDGGLATSAQITYVLKMIADDSGNVYLSQDNRKIRKISASTGVISHFAGNGSAGNTGDGGLATAAPLGYIQGMASDSSGNVYLHEGNITRMVATSGIITTVYNSPTYLKYMARIPGYGFMYWSASNPFYKLIDSSFTTGSLRNIDLATAPYRIASKYSALIGVVDSKMHKVENSGIMFSRNSLIRYNTERGVANSDTVQSSYDASIIDASNSSSIASDHVYIGCLDEANTQHQTRFITVEASRNASVYDSFVVTIGASQTVATRSSQIVSVHGAHDVSVSNTINSGIVGSQDVTMGTSTHGILASFVGGSQNVAVKGMMKSCILGSTLVNVNQGASGTSINSLVVLASGGDPGDTSGININNGNQLTVLSSLDSTLNSNTGVVAEALNLSTVSNNFRSVISAIDNSSATQNIMSNISSLGHSNIHNSTWSAFIGGDTVVATNTQVLVGMALQTVTITDTTFSAILASRNTSFVNAVSSVVIGAQSCGAGTQRSNSTWVTLLANAMDGSPSPTQTEPGTYINDSGLFSSRNSEVFGATLCTVIGGEKLSSFYQQYSSMLGGLENDMIYSDRTTLAGGVRTSVGPYSHDSFIAGNAVSSFKEFKTGIAAGVSDSSIRKADNSVMLGSKNVDGYGLDKSASIVSMGITLRDVLESVALGSSSSEISDSAKALIVSSDTSRILNNSISSVISGSTRVDLSNSRFTQVLATQFASVLDSEGSLLGAALSSNGRDILKAARYSGVIGVHDSQVHFSTNAFAAGTSQSSVLRGDRSAILGGYGNSVEDTNDSAIVASVGARLLGYSHRSAIMASQGASVTNSVFGSIMSSDSVSFLNNSNYSSFRAAKESSGYNAQFSSITSSFNMSVLTSFGSTIGAVKDFTFEKVRHSSAYAIVGATLSGARDTFFAGIRSSTIIETKESLVAAGTSYNFKDLEASAVLGARNLTVQSILTSAILANDGYSVKATRTTLVSSGSGASNHKVSSLNTSTVLGQTESNIVGATNALVAAGKHNTVANVSRTAVLSSLGATVRNVGDSFVQGTQSATLGAHSYKAAIMGTGAAKIADSAEVAILASTNYTTVTGCQDFAVIASSFGTGQYGPIHSQMDNLSSAMMGSEESIMLQSKLTNLIASSNSTVRSSNKILMAASADSLIDGFSHNCAVIGSAGSTVTGQVTHAGIYSSIRAVVSDFSHGGSVISSEGSMVTGRATWASCIATVDSNVGYASHHASVLASRKVSITNRSHGSLIAANEQSLIQDYSHFSALLGGSQNTLIRSARVVVAGGRGNMSYDTLNGFMGGAEDTSFAGSTGVASLASRGSSLNNANLSASAATHNGVISHSSEVFMAGVTDAGMTGSAQSAMLGSIGGMMSDALQSVQESSVGSTIKGARQATQSATVDSHILYVLQGVQAATVGSQLGTEEFFGGTQLSQVSTAYCQIQGNDSPQVSSQVALYSSFMGNVEQCMQAASSNVELGGTGTNSAASSGQFASNGSKHLQGRWEQSAQIATYGSVLYGQDSSVRESVQMGTNGCTGGDLSYAAQIAALDSVLVKTSGALQAASHSSRMINASHSIQLGTYWSEMSHSSSSDSVAQIATGYGKMVDVGSQTSQISVWESYMEGTSTSIQQATVGCTGMHFSNSIQSASWNSVFDGGHNSIQQATSESFLGNVSGIPGNSTTTAAQVAVSNSSLINAAQSAQMASWGVTGINGSQVIVAGSRTTLVRDSHQSAVFATTGSEMQGASGSAIIATRNSKVVDAANAVVLGGVGGLADHDGQVTQGAGSYGVAGLAQKSTVMLSAEVSGDTGHQLALQGVEGKYLNLALKSTYQINTNVVVKGSTGTLGMFAKYEGLVVVGDTSADVFSNIALVTSSTDPTALLTPSNVVVGMTGAQFQVNVTGYTGIDTRWVSSTELTKVSF